jgi:uridine kinase
MEVEGGSTLLDFAERIKERLDIEPICALVNNKTADLCFPIYSPKQVEFLDRRSRQGRNVYVRTLCMMLYYVVVNTDPNLTLRFEHSISKGHFCRVFNADGEPLKITEDTAAMFRRRLQELADADIPFVRREKLTRDVIEIFRAQHLHDKVELLETLHDLYTTYYTLGDVADSYHSPLAPSTGSVRIFDIRPYHDGMLLLGPDTEDPERVATPIKQEKMFRAFTDHLNFNRVIRVSNVAQLNRAVATRQTASLINVAEAIHDKLLGRISDEILRRKQEGGASIILMAGPSSSGKTTTSMRLAIQLMTNLIVPKMISLDDYFVDRVNTPLDENGDYDYESLYALDLERFNSDLNRLLKGEEINLPTYSFELGRRVEKERPLRLEKNDVLLIEGIHGLNPQLTADIDPKNIFKIYVSALTTLRIDDHNWISTAESRLLRRIVRDAQYRHTSPEETIRRWPSVRRGEEKWIFPFQENADATFNSSLIFEIGVMKAYAEPMLRKVPHTSPEYAVAYRLIRLLSYFDSIPADQVPTTSLLREFLGGSSFHY